MVKNLNRYDVSINKLKYIGQYVAFVIFWEMVHKSICFENGNHFDIHLLFVCINWKSIHVQAVYWNFVLDLSWSFLSLDSGTRMILHTLWLESPEMIHTNTSPVREKPKNVSTSLHYVTYPVIGKPRNGHQFCLILCLLHQWYRVLQPLLQLYNIK